MTSKPKGISRREILHAVGAGAVALVAPSVALATAEQVAEEAKKLFPGKTAVAGKIKLDLPTIAENGLVVPLNFEVESPMTDKDYVTKLHLLSTANPQPAVATFHFTPQSGKAAVSGRMRLAKTQEVVALAETSTGRLLKGARVIE